VGTHINKMFNNWNHNQYINIKNFMAEKDFKKIKKDLIKNFNKYPHSDKLKSGKQTTSSLHKVFTDTHWKKYFKKLTNIMTDIGKDRLYKCWALKVTKNQKQFLHKHPENKYTSVFYVCNDNYALGTRLVDNNVDIIIPGHENSILIFEGTIVHDAVFPTEKIKKPRYTLVTDYE